MLCKSPLRAESLAPGVPVDPALWQQILAL